MNISLHYASRQGISLFVLICSFLMLLLYGLPVAFHNQQIIFFIAAAFAQAALLSAPAWLLEKTAGLLQKNTGKGTSFYWLVHCYAVSLILIIDANYQIHSLYGFYINSFVWNIITTPGGIEAMGLSNSFYVSLTVRVLLVSGIYGLLITWRPWQYLHLPRLPLKIAIPIVFIVQAGTYAYANHTGRSAILISANAIPWYVSVTAKGLLNRLGVQRQQGDDSNLDLASGTYSPTTHVNKAKNPYSYPEVDPTSITLQTPYNIVWLVAESWRADMLNPRVMPLTHAFASNNIRFDNHYSGGNGTRMGMFTQFYGLHGNYWFDTLTAKQPPVVLETLRHNDYCMRAFTSARFSYPEFDRTIFSAFTPQQLQSYSEGEGWQRDRKNVSDLINFISKDADTMCRQSSQPFFAFMFFESPHAKYYFPPESVIEPDYLQDFNYLTADFKQQMPQIKARYINAVHHLDSQIDRVLQALQDNGQLDNTVVIITGDHGEEFMENNRWGHNSTFSEQQIKVPLILHIPGHNAKVVQRMTSHVDLPETLLTVLSRLENIDKQALSFGHNLLDADYKHDYVVVSDWHGSALLSHDMKLILSPKASSDSGRILSRNDRPLQEERKIQSSTHLIGRYLQDIPRFYHLNSTAR